MPRAEYKGTLGQQWVEQRGTRVTKNDYFGFDEAVVSYVTRIKRDTLYTV